MEPIFKRQSLERTARGAPSQGERGGECDAVHLGFHMDNRNEDSGPMEGVEGNMELLLLWKIEAERGRNRRA